MEHSAAVHSHVFLGAGHEKSERKTWAVIWLCGAMMAAEIVGGTLFGSVALVADGLHMSTHAAALLIAALAYSYARRHATDGRFAFGTGKLGDLAGFTSAIVLAMIALLIGYEAVGRLLAPVTIDFNEAIPIAVVGLLVNIASAWLLSGGDHHGHSHGHGHAHGHGHHDYGGEDEIRRIDTGCGVALLEVFEDGVPPHFRMRWEGRRPEGATVTVETLRPDGSRQVFAFSDCGRYVESVEEIPEPHEFMARLRIAYDGHIDEGEVAFTEHSHTDVSGTVHRDNNMRAALVHVVADAAVSVLVIIGLLLGRQFGWLWLDPVVGMVGAFVIASWAYGLIRDSGAILLDMTPDRALAERMRKAIETDGDQLADLHLWRLGPGHLGAIVSVVTAKGRTQQFYRAQLAGFRSLSHLTVEVHQQ